MFWASPRAKMGMRTRPPRARILCTESICQYERRDERGYLLDGLLSRDGVHGRRCRMWIHRLGCLVLWAVVQPE
jgi:hypothetical protein